MIPRSMILSIDDDAGNQELLKKTFENHDLHVAFSGEEGVALAREIMPDVILLDIAMPGMNGIEVCKTLKADPKTANIPVLFVSALNTLEDRLAGYKAGAEDYICKPINLYELKCKIDILRAYRSSLSSLDSQLRAASEVAFSAMSSTSELGVVVNFVEHTQNCNELVDLADMLLDAIGQFQISGCLVIRCDEANPLYFSNSVLSPLETQLLDMAHDGKRIVSIGRRALFNSENISILIKDMPADEERCGRLRDHVCRLMMIADARCKSIINEKIAAQYRDSEISKALSNAGRSLKEVDNKIRRFQSVIESTMSELITNVERELIALMLSEEQEDALLN
ncbi:MAG TPA: response regulator, partial [Pseudomonadales bacterium]|nr:response regulator [Pseudomonadales bacterium]